jgi:hypothetical protein
MSYIVTALFIEDEFDIILNDDEIDPLIENENNAVSLIMSKKEIRRTGV